jgi:UDP-glucose 4-epimerase
MTPLLDTSRFAGERCLITGGLGFLGSNLAHHLVRAGAEVTLVDSMIPGYGGNLANIQGIESDVRVNFSDIRDRTSMDYLVREQRYVFHVAGQVSHVMSLTDPFPDIDINIGGTTVLLEAMRLHNPEAKVVFSSTRGAYGEVATLPATEDQPSHPKALHEISKLTAELILQTYARHHGIESASLRLTNTYGPRSQMQHGRFGVLNYFVRLAMDGETIKVFGDGMTLRDYLYVDDAVEAFLRAALEQAPGESPVFNVGRPVPTSLRELVETIIDVAGTGSWELAPFSAERKAQEPGDFYSDVSRIGERLLWQPRTELRDGLEQTIDYYRNRRASYWQREEAAVTA